MTSKEALREIITASLKYLPDNIIDKISGLSNIVLQDLNRLEKLKRAIEILDNKLDIMLYKEVFSQDYYLDYNSSGKSRTAFPITKEQCELLKEVFENE